MNKDFDHLFKSKLEQHESPYPSGMWDAIDKEINPRKKNRALFILPIAFVAIALISVLVWNMYDTKATISTADTATHPSDILSTEEYSPLADKQDNAYSNQAASDPKKVEIKNNFKNEGVQLSDQSKSLKEYNSVAKQSKGLEAKANENSLSDFTAASSENKSSANKNNINSNRLSKNDAVLEIARSKRKSLRRNSITFSQPLLGRNNASQKTKKDLEIDTKTSTGELENVDDVLESASLSNSLSRYINPVQDLSSITYYTESTYIESNRDKEIFELEVMIPAAATDCPSWVNEKLGLYLEVYGAPEFAMSALTAKSRDSLTVVHQQTRENTESSRMSYSLGGRLLFLTPSGLSFKIGMNYSQINEKFSWVDPETERVITIEDIDQNGDTIGVQTYSEFGSDVFNIANSYKSLDIPILIGFEKYSGNKFSLSANAGIYVNITSEQRGMFIDPTGTRNWFSSSEDNHYRAYKNSVGISFFGSLGMMYHWVEGIDIFMEPSVRYYSQSMSLNSYPLNHRFVTVGLHTGIRYRF